MKLRLIVDLRVMRVKNSIPLSLKHGKQTQLLPNFLKIVAVCYGRVKLFLKLNSKAICICDKLEETFDNVRFNKHDCDATLRSLSVSDDDRN